MLRALSAVHVVMMSAPSTASSTEAAAWTRKPSGSRFRRTFSTAAGSMSNTRRSSMPSTPRKASAWNSHCEPAPIRASVRDSERASAFAAIAEVAAVRSAVSSVISARNVG